MAQEIGFEQAFREGGGRRSRRAVPYPITHEYVREACAKKERLLRYQYEDGHLAPEDEAVLARLSLDHPDEAWIRWDYVKGLWHVWERGYRKAEKESDVTAHLLLSREPVAVRVAGAIRHVTSRSRAQMIALARHERRRRAMGEDLDRIETLLAGRLPGKRRRFLQEMADLVEAEWTYHFCGILANALAEDGFPHPPADAPAYWPAVTAEDEGRVLVALFDAGPGRVRKLGRPPEHAKKPGEKEREPEFGWDSLLAAWEAKLNLPPASLNNTDLAQFSTWLRAGAWQGAEANTIEEAFAA